MFLVTISHTWIFQRKIMCYFKSTAPSVTSFVLLWICLQSSLFSVFSDTYSVWSMPIDCIHPATAGLVIFGSIVCLSGWATSCGYEGLLCWLGWKFDRMFFWGVFFLCMNLRLMDALCVWIAAFALHLYFSKKKKVPRWTAKPTCLYFLWH